MTVRIGGLPELTPYGDTFTVFLFAQDFEPTGMSSLLPPAVPNKSPVQAINGSTVDRFAPVFRTAPTATPSDQPTGYGPSALITTVTLAVETDEAANCYYVGFPASVPGSGGPGDYAPNAAQVVAGTDYTGTAAAVAGSWALAANVSGTVTTTVPLVGSSTYDFYIVCADLVKTYLGGVGSSSVNQQAAPTLATALVPASYAPLWTGNPWQAATSDLATFGWTNAYSRFPHFTAVSATGFTLSVSQTEAGNVLYAVVPRLDADPTKAQVAALAAGSSATYVATVGGATVTPAAAGRLAVAANVTAPLTVSGLSASTDYAVYLVTQDGATGNLGDGDLLQGVVQNANKLAPGLYNIAPVVSDTQLVLTATPTSAANVTYVVLNAGAPAPTPWQVVNGLDSNNNSAPCYNDPPPTAVPPPVGVRGAGGSLCYLANTYSASAAGRAQCVAGHTPCTLATVTNLTAGTAYDVYYVTLLPTSADVTGPDYPSHGIRYDAFSRVPFKVTSSTSDTAPPDFLPGYPAALAPTSSSFNLVVQMSKPGSVSYVVLSQVQGNAPTQPTAAQVLAGTDAAGNAPLAAGTISMPALANPRLGTGVDFFPAYAVNITGLTPATVYDTYVVAQDANAQVQATATRVVVLTLDSNSALGLLSVAPGALLPPFNAAHLSYDVFLNDTYTSVAVDAAPASAEASLTINGVAVAAAAPQTYALSYGSNTFALQVTAGDGVATTRYALNVHRVPSFNAYNATLLALGLSWVDPVAGAVSVNSTQMGGAEWPACLQGCLPPPLSPASCDALNPSCVMDAAQLVYYVAVPSAVATVTVAATTTSPLATVSLFLTTPTPATATTTVASLQAPQPLATSPTVDLAALEQYGASEIKIGVVAPDGTSTLYVIKVTRYGPGVYEGWAPVVPTTAQLGPRYGEDYAGDDPLTVRVLTDATVAPLYELVPPLDIEPPAFLPGYPLVTPGVGSVSFRLMTNKPSVAYYMVVQAAGVAGVTAPDPSDLRAGAVPPGDVAAALGSMPDPSAPIAGYGLTRETSATVGGLTSGANYTVFFVAQDKALDLRGDPKPNLQPAVTTLSFVAM